MIPGFTPTRRRVRLAGIVSVSLDSSKVFGVRRRAGVDIVLRVVDEVVCVSAVVVFVPCVRLGLLMGPDILGVLSVVSCSFEGCSSSICREGSGLDGCVVPLAALLVWAN